MDGFILQGPVSDRESLVLKMEADALKESLQLAADMIAEGKEKDIMPWSATRQGWTTPISAYRWDSLYGKGFVAVQSWRAVRIIC